MNISGHQNDTNLLSYEFIMVKHMIWSSINKHRIRSLTISEHGCLSSWLFSFQKFPVFRFCQLDLWKFRSFDYLWRSLSSKLTLAILVWSNRNYVLSTILLHLIEDIFYLGYWSIQPTLELDVHEELLVIGLIHRIFLNLFKNLVCENYLSLYEFLIWFENFF